MIFCFFAFICILNSKGINLLPDHFALFLFASCPIQCTFALAGKVIFWNSFIPFQFALLQFVESFSIRLLLMYYSFPISFVVIIFVISLFLYFQFYSRYSIPFKSLLLQIFYSALWTIPPGEISVLSLISISLLLPEGLQCQINSTANIDDKLDSIAVSLFNLHYSLLTIREQGHGNAF